MAIEEVPRPRGHQDDAGRAGRHRAPLDARRFRVLAEQPRQIDQLGRLDEHEGAPGRGAEPREVLLAAGAAVEERRGGSLRPRRRREGHGRDARLEGHVPAHARGGGALEPQRGHRERLRARHDARGAEALESPLHGARVGGGAGRPAADLVGQRAEVVLERRRPQQRRHQPVHVARRCGKRHRRCGGARREGDHGPDRSRHRGRSYQRKRNERNRKRKRGRARVSSCSCSSVADQAYCVCVRRGSVAALGALAAGPAPRACSARSPPA